MHGHKRGCCFAVAWWTEGYFPLASVSTAGWSPPWLGCLKGRVLLAPMVPASVQAPGILLGESTKAGPGKDGLDPIR